MEAAATFDAPANDLAPDPSDVRLAALAEMRQMGLALMRELAPRAATDVAEERARREQVRQDIAAYATVTRALRLTLRQEAEEGLESATAGEAKARRPYTDKDYWRALARARLAKRERTRELMREIAEHEIGDIEKVKAYVHRVDRRIDEYFSYPDFVQQDLRKIIEDLADATDFTPSWGLWNGAGWNIDRPRPPIPRPKLE